MQLFFFFFFLSEFVVLGYVFASIRRTFLGKHDAVPADDLAGGGPGLWHPLALFSAWAEWKAQLRVKRLPQL